MNKALELLALREAGHDTGFQPKESTMPPERKPTLAEAEAALRTEAGQPGVFADERGAHLLTRANVCAKAAIGLTLSDIEAEIVATDYMIFPGSTITVCVLTLRNSARQIGYSYGAINPNRQDWEQGRKAAREMAVEALWEKEAYLLLDRLSRAVEGA